MWKELVMSGPDDDILPVVAGSEKEASAKEVKPAAASLFKDIPVPQAQPRRTAWLMSFTDLTGILVGFFVLVYSTQTIDRTSWQSLAGSFHAAFAPNPLAVMPVVPQGSNNALQVVAPQHDALPYLDSLLRMRLKKDPLWGSLSGREVRTSGEHVMLYPLPPDLTDPANPQAIAAWKRLADVVRGWKNPVAVRITLPPQEGGQMNDDAARAVALARILALAGVRQVAGEVVSGNIGAIELVVKAEE